MSAIRCTRCHKTMMDDGSPCPHCGELGKKVGRNDPCPCGSGKKYKRCHLTLPAALDAAFAHAQRSTALHLQRERERVGKYGYVRPILHETFQGQKLVIVGNQLHYGEAEKIRTFPDFLSRYLKGCFGKEWHDTQLALLPDKRHTVRLWFEHICAQQAKLERDPATGLYGQLPDGLSMAYITLAYDLYVLRDNALLQERVMARLRNQQQFFGARYELFVTAMFVRAGFKIALEDESDLTQTHPEFVATHDASGFVLAVEAKAKERPRNTTTQPARVRNLLLRAAKKQTVHPYAVFVEVNLPPEPGPAPSWEPEVDWSIEYVRASRPDGVLPFDLMWFTNVPHQYGVAGGQEPTPSVLVRSHPGGRVPPLLVRSLLAAFAQFRRIPQDFPPK